MKNNLIYLNRRHPYFGLDNTALSNNSDARAQNINTKYGRFAQAIIQGIFEHLQNKNKSFPWQLWSAAVPNII